MSEPDLPGSDSALPPFRVSAIGLDCPEDRESAEERKRGKNRDQAVALQSGVGPPPVVFGIGGAVDARRDNFIARQRLRAAQLPLDCQPGVPRAKNTRWRIGAVLTLIVMALWAGRREIAEIARFATTLHLGWASLEELLTKLRPATLGKNPATSKKS